MLCCLQVPCNCSTHLKVNGVCAYNSLCRHSIVVYKATCKQSKKYYIGNTQQKLKTRMTQHYNKAKDLVNKGLMSDSFAKHAATCFPTESKISANNVRTGFNIEILWHGNPISCTKSFGRLTCSLCMKERLEIMKAIGKEPGRLIMVGFWLLYQCGLLFIL